MSKITGQWWVSAMMGNGLANIAAAIIIAAAILWNGGFGRNGGPSEEDFAEWYARAVGDIRNDMVVNCDGGGEGQRRAGGESF